MTPSITRRPSLAILEDRLTPALSVIYHAGNLTVTGTPTAGEDKALLIQRTAGTDYNVSEVVGATTIDYGTFRVTGDVKLQFRHYNTEIKVNLADAGNAAGTLPGNLLIDLGLGDVGPTVSNFVSIYGEAATASTIAGSLILRNGNGRETVFVGTNGGVDATPVNIGGDLRWTARTAGDPNFIGDTLTIAGSGGATLFGSRVARHVLLNQVDGVSVGTFSFPDAKVAGHVIVNNQNSPTPTNVNIVGSVNGDVVVVGTNTSIPGAGLGDFVRVEDNAVVNGNLVASLGDNLNLVQVGAQGVVHGSLTMVGGSGDDDFEFQGSIDGSMSLVLGDGNNSMAFDATSVVSGNLSVVTGNGADTLNGTIAFALGGFLGTVHGDVSLDLGNGDNSFTLGDGVNGVVNGKNLNYRGGSGVDTLVIFGANTFALRAELGAGADTFEYQDGAEVASAYIDFGTDFNADTYTQHPNVEISWSQWLVNL